MKHLSKLPGIYLITNSENGKVWVGQATSSNGIYRRCKSHLQALRYGGDSTHLQRAWDKYGEDIFVFETLLLCPIEQCDYWEDYYIGVFQSWKRTHGYNIMRLATGKGRISEETKKKISDARKIMFQEGFKNPFLGKEHDKETRDRMSKSKKGKPAPNKGVSYSQEVRDRMSKAKKGKPGKRWIKKDGVVQKVSPEDLTTFLEDGWEIGRS